MTIAHTDENVIHYMDIILRQGIENPVLVDKYMMGTELEVDVISDGRDVLIPGVMQHVERAGVHSGDSIAVYPPFSISDKMLMEILDSSEKLTLALGTKGLVNIQYLIYGGELYVIEVNPRASRTIPYISKVTGVPMVDLATRMMVGQSLKEQGYGTGLYRQPPYFAVKVPVFSFEKLQGVNSTLSPEMKSTGEVLGLGGTRAEAMFKGLLAAGFKLRPPAPGKRTGILISVNKRDQLEILDIARKFDALGFKLYATDGTARSIERLGIDVEIVGKLGQDSKVFGMLESGTIDYVIITGTTEPAYIEDFILLNRRTLQLGIPCLTSLDTANMLADILASRYTQMNTELVSICSLRTHRKKLNFVKMQSTGNDFLLFENFGGEINCPESLAISFTDRHRGIGADGMVLLEASKKADAKMRFFNSDGSEGRMAGNCIRCVGKYLYDKGLVRKLDMTVETASGIKTMWLYSYGSKVGSASVDMGRAELSPALIPVKLPGEKIIGQKVKVAGGEYEISCISVGNPHCVIFVDRVDDVDIEHIGPVFENDPLFPERVNTEFVRFVNKTTLKMRVWERGSGETLACGTGACAAVAVACELGLCSKGEDVTVKVRGGDLIVNYTDDKLTLTGSTDVVFSGTVEY
jgi:carbamoyl-phosphate synthase large subunit